MRNERDLAKAKSTNKYSIATYHQLQAQALENYLKHCCASYFFTRAVSYSNIEIYYGSGGKKIIAKTLQDILLPPVLVPEVSMRLVREDLESPVETEEDCDCTISLA
ncbi:hypothetical protein BDB00DRAFT_790133 [Zychaea mexicana]|uniref:uncharacterized protein n=1 Tax=Zychaea mexicana TaxID=64656 RepID=UPI0022FF1C69|nr:uncharacterized protein BDB00DRAFT_790133 [Zychaea mexicana]KAI9490752.1 hypothetical protein BDB00DRAFT_790133 [Zychaea mexicana]